MNVWGKFETIAIFGKMFRNNETYLFIYLFSSQVPMQGPAHPSSMTAMPQGVVPHAGMVPSAGHAGMAVPSSQQQQQQGAGGTPTAMYNFKPLSTPQQLVVQAQQQAAAAAAAMAGGPHQVGATTIIIYSSFPFKYEK